MGLKPNLSRSDLLLAVAATVLGVAGAAGFRPMGLWPLALLGVAGLLHLVVGARRGWGAFGLGWCWGVGHFCLGDSWIATAFTYQASMPAWLGWVGVFLLSLYLAVYPGLAAWGGWWFRRRPVAAVLAFGGSWIVAEWLRAWVFTGFAWNPLGAAALGGFGRAGLAQVLPWTGTYALSGLVVVLAGLWWLGFGLRVRRPVLALVLVAVPLGAMLVPDLARRDGEGNLPFTLVQPGVRQEVLDDPANFEVQFQTTARLSEAKAPGARRLVLWPESGVPDYLRDGYPRWAYVQNNYAGSPVLARARIGRAVGPGSLLLTGAVDLDMTGSAVSGARNVVTALDPLGQIRGSYAKAHLVPYGEYLPMRGLLEPLGLSRLVPGSIDFLPGPGARTLDLGAWGRAAVQICYEIVFSGEVVDRAGPRPDYIFNPTNDGWFGPSGPPQHLAQARMRAIEEGLPVLRATTNGISAVIDANGIVRASLPRPVAGRLDGLVPPAHAPTLFGRLGNVLALCWAAVLLAAALLALRRGGGYQA
jgi:apolipoprotein N-acyltransferase